MSISSEYWTDFVQVDDSTECWLWLGYLDPNGYGRVKYRRSSDGGVTTTSAHRWVYIQMVGDPGGDLHLDHLCRNPRCVNPSHLEPVTITENFRRGENGRLLRTHCRKGHPYDAANTRMKTVKGRTFRQCHACTIDDQRRHRRAAAARRHG